VLVIAVVLAVSGLLVACGGSSSGPTGSEPTLDQVLGTPGADSVETPLVLVLGGTDFPTGKTVRIPFQIFEKDGRLARPDGGAALLYLAQSPESPALGPFPVREESLQGDGVQFEREGTETILVADVPLPSAGAWIAVATLTVDGKETAASNGLGVLAKEATPAIGDPAPATPTPTLADVDGDAERITTQVPADRSLLRHSVADLLRERRPFVVAFATPKFCTSRICGPIVDIVLNTQRAMKDTDMAFVHAEIFENLDPSQGTSPWILDWGLPSEPWIFVVNADGKVVAKFEGAVTERELETAARAALVP